MPDPDPMSEPKRVFLCHSSGDKAQVRDLYRRLRNDGFGPWLDEEDLLPGRDWSQEIRKAVRSSAVVLICLSNSSIAKTGFVQKEIKYALDVADEQPDGSIFLIPVRLEGCDVPERLRQWRWVDLFDKGGYDKLLRALHVRLPLVQKKIETLEYPARLLDLSLKAIRERGSAMATLRISLTRFCDVVDLVDSSSGE